MPNPVQGQLNGDGDPLDYLSKFPVSSRGDSHRGEIEMLMTPQQIRAAEACSANTQGNALPPIGVVYEDRYIAVVRDAVRFPSGSVGTYLRLLVNPNSDGCAGVAVLCTSGDLLGLVRIFRHGIREWSLEIPRGFSDDHESEEAAAARELHEETGLIADVLTPIGRVCPDAGLHAKWVALYAANCSRTLVAAPQHDQSEAIAGMQWLDQVQFADAVRSGRVSDGITLAAIQLASVFKVLPRTW